MNKKTIAILMACAGIALSSVTSVANADNDRRERREWKEDRRHFKGHGHPHGKGHHHRDWRDDRRHERRGYERGYDRGYDRAMYDQRRWARGDRLPPGYHRHYHVVHDWHSRRLHRPHPGYQWMQVGTDVMLVAIASGVIAQIILSR